MSNWKARFRSAGGLFVLFLVDVAANFVADAISIFTRFGGKGKNDPGHPASETPDVRKTHASSDHASSAIEIATIVLVVLILLCTVGACAGVWFKVNIVDSLQQTINGFSPLPDEETGIESAEDDMEVVDLHSDSE